MFTSKDKDSQMQPSCLILEDVETVDRRPGFDGIFSRGKSNGQASNASQENTVGNVYSSLLSGLDAPYLSISPMLAFRDNFEPRPDEEDPSLDASLQLRQHVQLHFQPPPQEVTFPTVLDADIQECLSTDHCTNYDGFNNNWNEMNNVPEFLKYTTDSIIDDDLFISTKSGGCADPTLAELNANPNRKSIFDDLPTLDDLPMSEECSQFKFPTLPTSPQDSQDALVISTPPSTVTMQPVPPFPNLSLVKTEISQTPSRRNSTLHDLLLQNNCPINKPMVSSDELNEIDVKDETLSTSTVTTYSVPICNENKLYISELVSPTPKRRQRTSTISSTSSGCDSHIGTLLETSQGNDSEDKIEVGAFFKRESDTDLSDSDADDSNNSNDHESDEERMYEVHRPRTRSYMSQDSKPKRRNKRGRYFWQYNLQAKGPKGNRLPLATEFTNPHKLEQVTDPVFSPRCIIKGIKHTGKARKGDGNDLTPNPEKLHQIGQSLKNLNQVINDLTPVNELPVNVRPKSRKEKNKLASRVCRLKKKAQHEANKIKLYGLQQEHVNLMNVLKEMRRQYREQGCKNPRDMLRKFKEMESQFISMKAYYSQESDTFV
ncbi:hypothetical protein CHUAL_010159 [Chamberlinius hualienensis]